MKKILIFSTAGLFMCFSLILGQAQADALDFMNLYTTASGFPDETPKNKFDFTETPYLFLELPEGENLAEFTVSFWQGTNNQTSVITIGASETKRWTTPNNWDIVKEVGDWTINASWFNSNTNNSGVGSTTFTVTPEPVSTILFFVGGVPMAFRLYKRRRLLKV
ncbi:hypothetical protein MNBD_UNCLBAC01-1739 [hydrothermal vent metagenome]|uniref:Uncharacterized protein n=1 Tax=hydrothermal vent metagenome TaxID=652676 RepID=A0A3B1DHU7_9ZZZZ